MAKIITDSFTKEKFNEMVLEFLFSDARISLPDSSLHKLREHLFKTADVFTDVFNPYFEKEGNKRYDRMIKKMELFLRKMKRDCSRFESEEKKALLLFWNEITDIIQADYLLLHDQYLANSCNYLIYEIKNLC
jgi:hypothetical protein